LRSTELISARRLKARSGRKSEDEGEKNGEEKREEEENSTLCSRSFACFFLTLREPVLLRFPSRCFELTASERAEIFTSGAGNEKESRERRLWREQTKKAAAEERRRRRRKTCCLLSPSLLSFARDNDAPERRASRKRGRRSRALGERERRRERSVEAKRKEKRTLLLSVVARTRERAKAKKKVSRRTKTKENLSSSLSHSPSFFHRFLLSSDIKVKFSF